MKRLGRFDIVYSWGVLHHTGRMWEAIRNSAQLVRPGGYYYIAIYNKVGGPTGSEFWLKIKRLYNSSPRPIQNLLEWSYMLLFFIANIARLRNPLTGIKNYKSMRGMSWRTDITDWLGGYPYEFATVDEIKRFMRANFPNFTLIRVKPAHKLGNNEFLFKRR